MERQLAVSKIKMRVMRKRRCDQEERLAFTESPSKERSCHISRLRENAASGEWRVKDRDEIGK